jgi:hypothetical protein
MSEPEHIASREDCPFLPPAPEVMRPSDTRALREGDDPGAYYLATLACAQSLWLQGKPAQALLQLNHALGVNIGADSEALIQWPLPYQAVVWIFTRRHEDGFMGNPVRLYQHLASRMSGPNKELRTWRAWACFHLAESVLPADGFPRDLRQITREKLEIPTWEEVLTRLRDISPHGEAGLLLALMG